MGKRYAIVIGVAAAGVMALGAQTTAAAPDVVKYDTQLTIAVDRGRFYHGDVNSEVRECMEGRRVVLFELRPGPDRKLGTNRSRLEGGPEDSAPRAPWGVVVFPGELQRGDRVSAKVRPKVGDGFVCRGDRSETLTKPGEVDRSEPIGVSGLGVPAARGSQTAAAAPKVVKYGTEVTITTDSHSWYHGWVRSKVKKCIEGRRVIVSEERPGADRRIGTDRSQVRFYHNGDWWLSQGQGPPRNHHRVYAKVKRKVLQDGDVCRAARSEII